MVDNGMHMYWNSLPARLAIVESRSPPTGLTGEAAPAAWGAMAGMSMSPKSPNTIVSRDHGAKERQN